MPSLPDKTYNLFVEFLEQRIFYKQHLTEDSVRYSFFSAALNSTNIQQHEIILERPHHHPKFKGKEIDMYIQASGNRPELFIEFKFHRKSDSSSPKPQKAGTLFKDFSRLSPIASENSRCLVIYLTDSDMADYFENNSDVYSAFWQKKQTGDFFLYDSEFRKNKSDTFLKSSGDFISAGVHLEFSAQLTDGHHLRVFEVSKS